jgi:uroporphyrin-III C-methyltransferase / precorrin-2 dehydrogenase / sirohydrochlorin ferrochelatase
VVLRVNYFPLFFDLRGQKVLVVGAGAVALRKVQLLERAQAAIIVVAPQAAPELAQRAADGALELRLREFASEDLEGARLVIVATSRRALNRWVASLAEARGIPVNVVDDREASRVIVPAIVDRDPVIIAVSSAGTSPVLARRLRERLEALIPRRIGLWATWLAGMRGTARRRIPSADARRRYFEMLVDGPAERRFVDGDERGARRIAQRLMGSVSAAPAGAVTLVGAGPGDPELLTLKALRALQDADVILHDRLVPAAVLDYARRDAERICVGKAAGGAGTSQEAINDLLIDHARRGRRVVRLKGGDPFIFGRGGEELEALARAGIAFSVVPGISAANGCAAYAGIPLTHRDHAHSVSFVTGHGEEASEEPDWASLARPRATAVFYMGLARLEHIVARLMENGAPAERPAALIAQGTTAEQQVIAATLGTIRTEATARRIQSPALLVVGEVAALHASLAWFGESSTTDSESQSA